MPNDDQNTKLNLHSNCYCSWGRHTQVNSDMIMIVSDKSVSNCLQYEFVWVECLFVWVVDGLHGVNYVSLMNVWMNECDLIERNVSTYRNNCVKWFRRAFFFQFYSFYTIQLSLLFVTMRLCPLQIWIWIEQWQVLSFCFHDDDGWIEHTYYTTLTQCFPICFPFGNTQVSSLGRETNFVL